MEVTDIPAVTGGAVTQQPLGIIPNSRHEELIKVTLVNSIVCDYSGNYNRKLQFKKKQDLTSKYLGQENSYFEIRMRCVANTWRPHSLSAAFELP